ncbi:MAG: hypothetical protein H6631_12020 [Anaerolineaceae bacterium]|nr:hypothetical protein [Anaerolineaceae bacterium]MCB9099871.1 hypothetical protein [Anaerolineales bacterium]
MPLDQTTPTAITPATPPSITITFGDETLTFVRRAFYEGQLLTRFLAGAFTLGVLASCVALTGFTFANIHWLLGLLLSGAAWFSYEVLAAALIDRQVIEITPTQVTSHLRPLPSLLFRYRLNRADIEWLSVRRNKPSFWSSTYSLLARTRDGSETELFSANNAEEVLYLAYEIERLLDLPPVPADESLSDLFAHRLTGFEGWQALVNRHEGLGLINRGTELAIGGSYGRCTVELTVTPEDEWSDTQRMTLRVTPSPDAAPPEPLTEAQLLDRLRLPESLTLTGSIDPDGDGLRYRPQAPITDLDALHTHLDLFCGLIAARPLFLAGGTPLIELLQEPVLNRWDHPFHALISRWLTDIATETVARWGAAEQRLLCGDCFTTITRHTLQLQARVEYYACREYRHSRAAIPVAGQVIAVLDESLPDRYRLDGPHLRVNWLQVGHLFDFDAVEIIRANDEQAERFAVQVGNNTDPTRQDEYARMTCHIDPEAPLSDNTRRVLRRLFGVVETA